MPALAITLDNSCLSIPEVSLSRYVFRNWFYPHTPLLLPERMIQAQSFRGCIPHPSHDSSSPFPPFFSYILSWMSVLIVDRLQMKFHKGLFNSINSPLSYLSCCHIPATAGNGSPPISLILCSHPCLAWWVSPAPAEEFPPLQPWQTFLSGSRQMTFFNTAGVNPIYISSVLCGFSDLPAWYSKLSVCW